MAARVEKRPRTTSRVPKNAVQKTAAPKKQGRPAGRTLGRAAILRAVCRLLRTRSYSQVTLALVARELKVDPALIRYYFRDHGTLMLLAGQAMREEFVGIMKAALARSDGTPEGLLRGRVSGLMEAGMRYPFLLRLLVDITYLNPHPTLRNLTENSVAFYKGVVDAGVAAGRFQPVEPMFLTMAVLGMVDAFTIQEPLFRASRHLGLSQKALRERYVAFMGDLLVNALRAPKVE
jgi:TetR/AcrR family transcriptional regulator